MIEAHYNLAEAAELLGVSEGWLRGKLRDHTYAGMKVAGKWRMRESQIEAINQNISVNERSHGYTDPRVSSPDPTRPALM